MNLWGIVTAILLASAPPDPVSVAVTVDDLPWSSADGPVVDRLDGNKRILEALTSRGIPAVGFVNCDRLGGDRSLLRLWLSAGMELGNHTASHLPVDFADQAKWRRDVERCHAVLRGALGHAPRYFRYPMLRQGATVARRDSAAAAIRRLGYTNAHVTIDNSEYLIAAAYSGAMKRGDSSRAESITRLYIDHMRAAMRHARGVATRKLGRESAQVLLLHVNRLNADHIGRMLDSLAADGARFVPLEASLRDPVFSRKDLFAGPKGLSWLYRIAPVDSSDVAWDDREAARVVKALEALRP